MIEDELAERVVPARYMQVLSNDLCRKLAGRAIEITTRFLRLQKQRTVVFR